MSSDDARPAFYAAKPGGRWRDWWTLLHPPYTAWHLAYVVIGAALYPKASWAPLVAALVAFFLAVGVGAHALDEMHGRPLRTDIPRRVLALSAGLALAGAVAIGIIGVIRVGPVLVPFIVVGAGFVVVYNLEIWDGLFHNDVTFALGWGSFPLLTAYVAEAHTLNAAAALAAAAAFFLSAAQRSLSTRARFVRRSVSEVTGRAVTRAGEAVEIDAAFLLTPIERALASLSWCAVALAVALVLERFG